MSKMKKIISRNILSPYLLLLLNSVFGTLFPAISLWGFEFKEYDSAQFVSLLVVMLIGIFSVFFFSRMLRYPGAKPLVYILPSIAFSYMIGIAVLFLARLPYSRAYLILSFLSFMLLGWFWYFTTRRRFLPYYAIIPNDKYKQIHELGDVPLHIIWSTDVSQLNKIQRLDGVIIDMSDEPHFRKWEQFITACALQNIPVYNLEQVKESLTGRVKVGHVFDEQLLRLLPSPLYYGVKRVIDVLFCLLSSPLVVPVALITAIAIKIDSAGPILFKQNRVGLGGKDFVIYKFRSMCVESEYSGARFAETNDARVTRVGRFIRRCRIDELPQLINVLRGNMSLIGPRPEQRSFVENFSENIYSYPLRHVVKPGITGWAQVMQGYAASENDTKIKLEYDLYYIKNVSLWLDVLIAFKTIKIILTGFGAR
ncbi:exopolysaccharide biosynthesis polyprenyl glycosylphosphotransferase [Aeromonas sp. RU39B]|uniref:exopolysaccharide biosynthesis polyprenyl glycosylphosphotransferase n=1 Tax=Aeromonas sp. RU39B TaxID=1907416 RepID=UPI000955C5CF|nr:exopolysaccharide biosynthesis polyprenyl glycosylphosphotransferase [Aeromonas sp. RU39B]SIQ14122.1 exopolysaccharide biosynthesis polyprenyl glycosylphosphotransferase [Aeromonas sp. RU39B]